MPRPKLSEHPYRTYTFALETHKYDALAKRAAVLSRANSEYISVAHLIRELIDEEVSGNTP